MKCMHMIMPLKQMSIFLHKEILSQANSYYYVLQVRMHMKIYHPKSEKPTWGHTQVVAIMRLGRTIVNYVNFVEKLLQQTKS